MIQCVCSFRRVILSGDGFASGNDIREVLRGRGEGGHGRASAASVCGGAHGSIIRESEGASVGIHVRRGPSLRVSGKNMLQEAICTALKELALAVLNADVER